MAQIENSEKSYNAWLGNNPECQEQFEELGYKDFASLPKEFLELDDDDMLPIDDQEHHDDHDDEHDRIAAVTLKPVVVTPKKGLYINKN